VSAYLWIDAAKNDALNLGDPFRLLAAFAELGRVVGDRYDEFADLFGVPDATMDDADADPAWLADVRAQAARLAAEFPEALHDDTRALLADLAGAGAVSESVVAEHAGAPPFPGAVLRGDPPRWHNPATGEDHPAHPDHPHAEHAAATAAHDAAPEEEKGRFAKARAGLAARLEKTAGGRVVLAMGRGGVWLFHQIEHRLLYAAKKTQEVAVAAAKERGLDPARVEKLKRALYVADFLGGYVTGGAALAVAGPYAGKAAAVMPSASVAYLAYSTAKNPAAVWRAARAVVRATFAKGTPAETPA
jgi:hypothetical protein